MSTHYHSQYWAHALTLKSASDSIDNLSRSIGSSELFVTHFRNTYDEFPNLPIWIATEGMSFGGLSRMFSGMDKTDQRPIAQRYRLQPYVLRSWMHHLVYVRNLCAHHCRLWDRVWAIKPQLPAGNAWQPPHLPENRHLFATLLVLRHLM